MSRRKITLEQWLERFNKIHNTEEFKKEHGFDHYDYSKIKEIKTTLTKIFIKCNIHDIVFECNGYTHYTKKRGCKKCGNKRKGQYNKLTNEIIDKKLILQHRDHLLERITDFITVNHLCKWRCRKENCKTIWEAPPNRVIGQQRSGCPHCRLSKGALEVERVLKLLGLKFDWEYWFDDCKNPLTNATLYFDFVIYDAFGNIIFLIEYQGEFHYNEICFCNKKKITKEKSKLNLLDQQYRDQLKRDFCNQNNILLIEAPYWEYNNENIENFLKEKLIL